MTKLILAIFCLAMTISGQTLTPIKVYNTQSVAGSIWLQERGSYGNHWFKLQAAQSIAADFSLSFPGIDGTNGQCIDTDGAGQLGWKSCGTERVVSDYDWAQSPGGSLSVGANTVTLSPCPGGLSATEHYVYISGGVGTAEVALMVPDTCTAGAATGTVTITAANTHSGAWTVESASDGWQEAIFTVADAGVIKVHAGIGTYNVYSDIRMQGRYVTAECDGPGSLLVPRADNIKVFHSAGAGGPRIKGCAINNVYSHTGVSGIYTYNPTGDSFGTSIIDTQVSGVEVCYDLQTVYGITAFAFNRAIDCTDTSLYLSNISTGDAGVGLIGPNNLFSNSVNAQYGVVWNGPGNFKLIGNSFNGFVEQTHLELTHGTVNVSGTSVTWVSGNKFRSSHVGHTLNASSTVTATIASYISDTSLTLSTSQPTCTGCSYYIGTTGQFIIANNTFDGGSVTTHSIRAVGSIPFFNGQIHDNFATVYTVSNYKSIEIDAAGMYFLSVKGNNLQTSTTGTTIGIDVIAGNYIEISDNKYTNHLTGTNIESGAVGVTTNINRCNSVVTTNCVLSDSSTSVIHEVNPVTYTQLASLTAANYSSVFCSDCKATSAASNTCTSGGTGSRAEKLNGAWSCSSANTGSPWIYSGADIYFSGTGNVGIHSAPVADLSIVGGGAGANSLLIQDGSAVTTLQLYAESGFAFLGTFTNHDFLFGSDSTTRWRLKSTGHIIPEITDTYDLGQNTTPLRIRGVYSKIVDTIVSGGTGDYVQTRKLQLYDNTGSITSTSFWDMGAEVNGVGALATSKFYIRDNSGVKILQAERVNGGGAVDRTFWFTDLLPDTNGGQDLGTSSYRWDDVYMNTLHVNNTVSSVLNPTSTNTYGLGDVLLRWSQVYGVIGNFSGNVTIGGDLKPSANNSSVLGDTTTPLRWASVNGVNGNFSGDLTVGTNLVMGSTTVINSSRNLVGLNAIGQDITFSSNETYDIGSTSSRLDLLYARGYRAYDGSYDRISLNNPGSGSNAGNAWAVRDASNTLVGYLTYSGTLSATTFTGTNVTFSGTMTPPSGTALNGTTTCGAGEAVKSITFSQGIATAITCAVP